MSLPFEVVKKFVGPLASTLTIASIIFFSGRESNRLDEVITKVHSAELERKDIKDVIFDMHGRVCSIEQDIKYIKDRK